MDREPDLQAALDQSRAALPLYGSVKECPKCGGLPGKPKYRWAKWQGRADCGYYGVASEHMQRWCLTCEFSWLEQVRAPDKTQPPAKPMRSISFDEDEVRTPKVEEASA